MDLWSWTWTNFWFCAFIAMVWSEPGWSISVETIASAIAALLVSGFVNGGFVLIGWLVRKARA